jgi:HprK-related kinase A
MTVGLLAPAELARRMRGDGLRVRTGPFVFSLKSEIESVQVGTALLYGDYPAADDAEFVDFEVTIAPGTGLRRWLKPQARFIFDGRPVFEPMPYSHAFPLMEWAMNWCIASHDLHHLTLHAAVIERGGFAAILPAPPGSGKSTLCAGLIHAGWRLLSDEMTLISLQHDRLVAPLCRPVSLKNASIAVIADWTDGAAVFNTVAHETAKGSVTHMKVPRAHLHRMAESATPRWVVFPRWQQGAQAMLLPRSRAGSLVELARNAFNFMALGETGFEVLADVVEQCECFDFSYSSLDEAVAVFDRLAQVGA